MEEENVGPIDPELIDKFLTALGDANITIEVSKGEQVVRRDFTPDFFASAVVESPIMITLQLIEMGNEIPPKA